jgi:DNA-binding Xre family transcriptional regulator
MLSKLPYGQPLRQDNVSPAALTPVSYLCDLLNMAKQRHFIREWRQAKGLTQEQLAERIGITKSYLSKIETGKKRYDQPFLEATAEALSCEPADLIVRNPEDPEGIWSIWDNLDSTARAQVVAIAKTFRKAG